MLSIAMEVPAYSEAKAKGLLCDRQAVSLLDQLLKVLRFPFPSPCYLFNKLASLEATLVRNSAHPLTYPLTDRGKV